MANARLHIICGNCGSNHQFEHEVKIELDDDTLQPRNIVYLWCRNCSTLHDLEDNSTLKSDK
jgi:transcription elongation factor Elf1